jgi:expansin (peptidoglycan-binding protein)
VWVAIGVVAVAVIGISALRFVTAACAADLMPVLQPAASWQSAPPSASTVTQGRAFFYNPSTGPGSCSLGPLPADGLYVSLATPQYAAGSACGSYLNVSGPAGTVRAEVVDSCPGCTNGGIDMSEAAFSRVASPAAGTALVSYQLARDPQLTGPLELRVAQSATTAWLAIQVINHGNPLSSVDVAPSGSPAGTRWQPLTLSPDDYWVAATGAGAGPFMVRVTDIFGHQVVADGIKLLPGAVQHTTVLMYAQSPSSQQPSTPPSSTPASTPSAAGTQSAVGGAASAAAHAAYPSRSGAAGSNC